MRIMKKRVLRIALALVMTLGIVAGATTTMSKDVSAACRHPSAHIQAVQIESCDRLGIYFIVCNSCNIVLDVGYKEPLPHSWQRVTTIQQATCTRDGWVYCKCTRCGAYRDLKVHATGHSMVTTFNNGILDRYCIVCGYREPSILV